MAMPSERLLGRTAAELGLADCLSGEPVGTVQRSFPGGIGRFGVRRSQFRQHGLPHRLLVLTDLSRTLREEERQAWQRLIRVLGHELNNSLTPIRSMASTLRGLVGKRPPPADWREDLQRGLDIIAERAESLSRFMAAYSRLARLPPPSPSRLDVGGWVTRVAELERRVEVRVRPGPDIVIRADGDQLEQLLINLVRNAADAALETAGGVEVGWRIREARLEVWVEDEGLGLPNSTNLFVPFFTTKKGGSGIGLALCQQIAEAHGGSIELRNRGQRSPSGEDPLRSVGCRALLRLPLDSSAASRSGASGGPTGGALASDASVSV
jgi:signal transduction histidine kinase